MHILLSKKKKRIVKVHANEGLRKDQKEPLDEMVVRLCRYKFPRYPLDKLEILYPVEKDDKNLNQYKKDMIHIKKYLARQCNDEASRKQLQEKKLLGIFV